MPPAVPPAFARAGGAGGRSRGRANGRIPGRFAGRSRVVPSPAVAAAGLSPMPAALWCSGPGAARPARRVRDLVGGRGLEPLTSCMSSMRSNQLS